MVDTLGAVWRIPVEFDSSRMIAELAEESKGMQFREGVSDGLGFMRSWSGRRGPVWWSVQSGSKLPPTLKVETNTSRIHELKDNSRVLSLAESQDAVDWLRAWASGVSGGAIKPEHGRLCRLDVCYQVPVADSKAVIGRLHGAVKRCWSKPQHIARYDSSIQVGRGVRVWRAYDKGLESKHEDLLNVIRTEEQLRGGATLARVVQDWTLNRDEGIKVMNERIATMALKSDELPIGDLIRGGSYAVALLALHPEYEQEYRSTRNRSSAYRLLKQVRELRASVIGADLSLPDDAWLSEN